MSSSKKEAMKLVVVILSVSLLALTIYNMVPQENRPAASSNGGSGPSTSQSATYWWNMFQTMATTARAGAAYSTPTMPSTSQTVPLTNQTSWTLSGANYTTLDFAYGFSYAFTPAAGDDEVFVVTAGGGLDAINASNGTVVWSYWSGYLGSPAYADDQVFVGTSNYTTCALDASTGALLWSYPTGELYICGPTVADGVVYVGSVEGNVYALNATTGTPLWNRYGITTGCYPDICGSSPTVADGEVFVDEIPPGGICALNASTGVVIWNSDMLLYGSSPAVVGGIVYVGSIDGNVYAFNAATGALVWNYTTGGPVQVSPAVANGVVYVGSVEGNVYALNATTGTPLWNYTTGRNPDTGNAVQFSSPVVAGGVVYIGSYDEDFYALNATNGALIWSHSTDEEPTSPVVYNDMVFVASAAGVLYAFGPPFVPPFSVSICPFSVEMNVGQSQVYRSSVIGGTPPYTFQWYLDGVPVSGAADASWTFTPTSAGSYTVYLEVTDSLGTVATSTDASLSVSVPAVISILNPGPDSCPSAWSASDVAQYVGTPDFVFYSNETPLGSTFFVNITVTDATDLYAWGIGLVYDNTTLQFVNAWLPTDNVFSQATASGATLIPAPAVVDTLPFNSTYAILKWGCTFLQGTDDWCFNGSGTLGQIEFKIIAAPNPTTPQITSTFTLDPDWTTTISWPIIPYPPTYDERAPLLETGSFAYIS